MPKDGFSGILSAFEEMAGMLQPYKDAVTIMQRNENFAKLLSDPLSDSLGIMNSALTKGLFDDRLSHSVSDMLTPYHEISDMQSALGALGSSFSPLIKPDIYSSMQLMADKMAVYSIDTEGMKTALGSLADLIPAVDTSWMKAENNWLVDKELLANLNTPALSGMNGIFASLCKLERETALMPIIPKSLISASSQIASIVSAIGSNIAIEDIYSSTRILSDYCDLAVKQHKMIQRASNQEEVGWRLDMLDAASKYVDRQVSWTIHIADQLSVDDADIDAKSLEEADDYESGVALIPTHIGYTKRADIDKTPSEGLEESVIVEITEKGKRISEGILTINKLLLDEGADRIFGLSETVVSGMMDVGNIVCVGADQLGKIIDGLYFIFYENLEHIKLVIGKGDIKKGDTLVRSEAVYQCIFNVKTIRSDLRHDLDHGKENERKKKLKTVGECYKGYCGKRPLKEKDFKKLQGKLYDEFITLENGLIEMLSTGVD